jgi:1-aminocyclopropane-1-carboxylate deaminase/D-cysteine desulfhydrase-like pyridoxal-dependent ACC family enzyme
MTAASPARTRLATLPTPLVAAPRLAQVMGTGPLYLKRDDLTGFAIGGNKARPLEFLVAAAVTDRADTLVTGGAPGSNFCAAVAAAALWAGLAAPLAARPGPGSGPVLGGHRAVDGQRGTGQRG